jgi:hypothetical protein
LVGLTVYFELAKDVTYGSTYATKRQGARAFFLSLRELGKDATPWLEPFESLKSTTENATMFVVSVPDFKGIDSLEEWVRKGNRLVLINSFPGAGFTKGVLNEQSTKDALLTLMDVEGKSTPVDCESILSQECDGVKYLSETGVSLGLVDEDIEILVGTAKNAKVAYQKVGKGDVFLISSESIILNQNIEKFDNFRFLYQIATAHKKIFFDEFHHGYRSPVAARMESRKNAVWVLIGTLVGVLLLGALSRAVRFGPPTEVPEIPLSSTVEFAGVLGMLYREHKAQEVLGCYIRSWRRRLSRRFGIALGLSHENALMQLVDKGMISSAQAKEATRYIFELENGAVSDSASEERVSYIERILETELAASM